MLTTARPLDRDLCRIGSVAATILAVLTTSWVASLILFPGPATEAGLADKLRYLADRPESAIGPALVVGLALLFIPVWLGLAAAVWPRRPAAGVVAVAFGLVYAPLASLNYWSQLTVVRGLAELSRTDPATAAATYRLFEFPAGLTSLSYGIDVFAYMVWGVAAIAIAVGLFGLAGPAARAAAVSFAAGGVLAVVGGVGYVVQNDALEIGVLLSGVAALVAVIAAAVLLHQASMEAGTRIAGVSLEVRLGPTHS